MKIQLFNDTHRTWRLHAAMEDVQHDKPEGIVKPLETLTVEVAEGQNVFVKLWEDGTVLVRGEDEFVQGSIVEAFKALAEAAPDAWAEAENMTPEELVEFLRGD